MVLNVAIAMLVYFFLAVCFALELSRGNHWGVAFIAFLMVMAVVYDLMTWRDK